MSLLLAPLLEETSTTEGTGTLSLDGATTGHRTFAAGFSSGASCNYTILWGAHWEYGVGTITNASPDTMARDLVIQSSLGGDKLSLGPGTKLVYCDVLPESGINGGVSVLPEGDDSPSVKNGRVFLANYQSVTDIFGFNDGVPGQEIIIISTNSNCHLNAGTNLRHPSALDINMTADDTVIYVKSSAWHLIGGSVNA